jgi:hypothetical protein
MRRIDLIAEILFSAIEEPAPTDDAPSSDGDIAVEDRAGEVREQVPQEQEP